MVYRLLSTLPQEHLLKVDEVLKADFELLNSSHEVKSACVCPQLPQPSHGLMIQALCPIELLSQTLK